MQFIDFLALGLMGISAYIFLSLTKPNRPQELDSFFYNSHETKSKKYGASVAAASTSLATVVVFFITGVEQYGIFLIWCGITYLVGQLSLLLVLRRSNVETSKLTTVADFWLEFSGCGLSAKFISTLTVFAFLFMLFLELFIGAQILTYYLNEASLLLSLACFLSLLLLVSIYVFRGGMYAVLKSDLWQYTLMLIAIITIAIVSIVYALGDVASAPEWDKTFRTTDKKELILFLIWVTVQNFTLPFTQLSSWQRIASSESIDTAFIGLKSITKGFLVLWILPVIAMLILKAHGVQFSNLAEFFSFLRESNNIVIYVSFAIIFVGFSSALFSTADSALMACALSVSDKSTFRQFLSKRSFQQTKKYIFLFMVLLILAEAFLFKVFFVQAGESFLSIVYVIFSQLTLIAPLIGYAIYKNMNAKENSQLSRSQDILISFGLLLGWLTLFYFNFMGDTYGYNANQSIIVGSFAGLGVSSLTFFISLTIFNKEVVGVKND